MHYCFFNILKELFYLKRNIALILALAVLLTGVFTACKKKEETGKTEKESGTAETAGGLNDSDTEIDFVEVDVTDKNGETVTDENGNPKKEEVPVVITRDKKGKLVAHRIDNEGNTKKETVPYKDPDKDNKGNKEKTTKKKKTTKPTKPTSMKTTGGEKPTQPESSTKQTSGVPTTNSTGTPVSFNDTDVQRVKKILEVPYLYKASYENAQGVPISIATHAALWMAEKDGLQPSTFASGTIVLGLFKYFGQTVVNFKSKCNDAGNSNINYNASNGTFVVSDFEVNDHSVTINKIEDLGNNYFKVTGKVSGGGKSQVIAILQKNKLDLTLGFSVKALKWS